MPKSNKEVKKYLLFVLGASLVFIGGMLGLDRINTKMDKKINTYKDLYNAQLQRIEEAKKREELR